jgi:hypothetical protein
MGAVLTSKADSTAARRESVRSALLRCPTSISRNRCSKLRRSGGTWPLTKKSPRGRPPQLAASSSSFATSNGDAACAGKRAFVAVSALISFSTPSLCSGGRQGSLTLHATRLKRVRSTDRRGRSSNRRLAVATRLTQSLPGSPTPSTRPSSSETAPWPLPRSPRGWSVSSGR